MRNQDGTAPWSTVEDVTFRLNIVRHTGSAVNILGTDNLAPSQRTKRILVKDNVFEDVSGANWGGSGRLFQILDGPADVDVDHNTAMHTGEVIMAAGPASSAFVYRNNMTAHNQYGVAGDGTFGDPMGTLAVYFPGAIFTKNVLMGGDAADYPAGNFFPISWAAVLFTNLPGGNYLLAALSPYRNAGSDGKDVGADIGALQAATANTISGGGGGGGGGGATRPAGHHRRRRLFRDRHGGGLGWTTNEASDSQADYGLTTSYGSATALDPTLVTAHTRTLSGLQPNTLYHFRVRSRDAAANLAVSGDVTFRTLAAPDTTPPVITGVGASSVTTTGAVVRWTTNEASDSQADYGLTTAYGSVTALDATLVTAHARTLSGLQPNTLYHFRVRSRDAAGNLAISGDVTFRTLAVADTTPPTVSFTGARGGRGGLRIDHGGRERRRQRGGRKRTPVLPRRRRPRGRGTRSLPIPFRVELRGRPRTARYTLECFRPRRRRQNRHRHPPRDRFEPSRGQPFVPPCLSRRPPRARPSPHRSR